MSVHDSHQIVEVITPLGVVMLLPAEYLGNLRYHRQPCQVARLLATGISFATSLGGWFCGGARAAACATPRSRAVNPSAAASMAWRERSSPLRSYTVARFR